ncbi:phage tail protein [uncultured Massilia sp.]|uniref:phage tail protein n=1 Tax=uncultured Massilia sp. TaxID=169973 RepID=UPI0025CC20A6|nr:tail fiber protein [uncultured Massilia sp.]
MSNPTRLRRGIRAALALLSTLPAMAQACDSEAYIGSICTFPYSRCPANFVPADGAILSIKQYQALYAITSHTFGGDGISTFGVPDLRGRMVVGMGTGAGLPPMARGQTPGQQTLVLDSAQAPLRAHKHKADFSPHDKQVTVDIPAAAGDLRIDAALPISADKPKTAAAAPAGKSYLTEIGAKVGPSTASLSGPYTTAAPATPAASKLPADLTLDGAAATPAVTAQLDVPTGGTVTVRASGARPAQPVSTQSPGLGLVVCIAAYGLYPALESDEQYITPDAQ